MEYGAAVAAQRLAEIGVDLVITGRRIARSHPSANLCGCCQKHFTPDRLARQMLGLLHPRLEDLLPLKWKSGASALLGTVSR
jgi:hypothetical protein